jgi:hypothetical protein
MRKEAVIASFEALEASNQDLAEISSRELVNGKQESATRPQRSILIKQSISGRNLISPERSSYLFMVSCLFFFN